MSYQNAFTADEYERRQASVKQRMVAAGFDLLICQDPASMCWLTGFDGWSFYTPQAVVMVAGNEAPIWFGRAQDAPSAVMTTDLPEHNIVSFSERLVHHANEHPFDELCELLRARGFGKARIGVELDAHYYTARAHQHVIQGLPDATIEDNRELVNWARIVKSDAEVHYLREAGLMVTETMNKALSRLQPGTRQCDVIADVYHNQIVGPDGLYGDYTGLCPLIQVGEGTSTPHLTWTDEPLPTSGLVVMELAAARRHYHAPLTRTAHLGKPPAQVAELTNAIVEAGDAALDAARPGVTCEDVEATWQKALNARGYAKPSRVGYSIGLNFPPDWGERTASLRPGDRTELQPGMCFHFQSGVWLEGLGAAVSEPFVVTTNGAERLSDVARELIVIN